MGNRSFVGRLAPDIQDELDRRLRAARYAGSVELAEWLRGQGFAASKSAVHRYAVALRAADADLGDARAMVAASKPKRSADEILMALGRLRLAEIELLEELRALPRSGNDPNAPPAVTAG